MAAIDVLIIAPVQWQKAQAVYQFAVWTSIFPPTFRNLHVVYKRFGKKEISSILFTPDLFEVMKFSQWIEFKVKTIEQEVMESTKTSFFCFDDKICILGNEINVIALGAQS